MALLRTKTGKDLSSLLDAQELASLEIGENTPLEIHTDGKSIIISPASGDDAFKDAVAELHAQYGGMLKRLA